jgi:hypothetical protein
MDLVQGILNPSKPLMSSLVIFGVLIAVGLIANNSNTQNKAGLSALGADTTVVGPFSFDELNEMYKQWSLDILSSGIGGQAGSVAANLQLQEVVQQISLYGNYLSQVPVEPFFTGFGAQDIQTLVTMYGYGWFVRARMSNNQIAFFKVVRDTDSSLSSLLPVNMTTYPLQYRLQFVFN